MPSFRPTGRAPRLGVLMVSSEAAPFAKTGGLADVLGALPDALDRQGHHVTTVIPRYRSVTLPPAEKFTRSIAMGDATYDVVFHIATLSPRRRVVFVENARLFDRDGFYGSGGRDFPDNALRFGLLSLAALEFGQYDPTGLPVDVIHAHDWQAGLVPAFLRTQPSRWPRLAESALVFTIHNLAYQGTFPKEVVPAVGLDWKAFTVEGAEFWNQISFLKAGITYSDYVTTVSPSYARESQTPAGGVGFDGVLRARGDRYLGILNGIDVHTWNPATDPMLPARFSAADLSGKRVCKRALLERFKLPVGDDALERPLIGLVSRLVDQKGLAMIEAASESLLELDATWVFVGTGDPKHERLLRSMTERHPSRVAVFIGFDEPLAHLVEAGADMFLMPSVFEPCGLNQMYSLRYGTVPIVHAVGGLEDTIQPYTSRARRANGFKFREATPEALVRTIRHAVNLFRQPEAWDRLVRQGMSENHSWEISAREYVKVYRRARHAIPSRWG